MAPPVKNTFIHYNVYAGELPVDDEKSCHRRRALRPCQSSPEPPPPLSVRLAAAPPHGEPAGVVEEASTPKSARPPDLISLSGDESTDIGSTPEHTPRHAAGGSTWSLSLGDCSPHPAGLPATPDALRASFSLHPTPTAVAAAAPPPHSQYPPPASPADVAAVPARFGDAAGCSEAGFEFSFTLRLAHEVGLGIDVVWTEAGLGHRGGLTVHTVLEHGAIQAWNWQCLDRHASLAKALGPGDVIVGINGKTDAEGMLAECRERELLRITVWRPWPFAWQWYAPGQHSYRLHADKRPIVLT